MEKTEEKGVCRNEPICWYADEAEEYRRFVKPRIIWSSLRDRIDYNFKQHQGHPVN